jgi:four helix bundle protein
MASRPWLVSFRGPVLAQRTVPRARPIIENACGGGAARVTVLARGPGLFAKGNHLMSFDAHDRALDLLRTLSPLLDSLTATDASLADQLRRASASIHLNIAEAARRTLRDRRNRYRIALGSAAEVTACLEVAIVFRYVEHAQVAEALELADRVRAMTYRLSLK